MTSFDGMSVFILTFVCDICCKVQKNVAIKAFLGVGHDSHDQLAYNNLML